MHASHSESSKKIYHRLYKLSADKISAKQFIRYSSGKPLYRILEINLSAEIKLVRKQSKIGS